MGNSGYPQRMKISLTLLFLIAGGLGIGARSPEGLFEQLLEAEGISYSQAVEAAAFSVEAFGGPTEEELRSRIGQKADSGELRRDQAALIVMQAFELEGGVLYRLLPNPRYAYRELRFREIILGSGNQGDLLTGREYLQLLSRARSFKERNR